MDDGGRLLTSRQGLDQPDAPASGRFEAPRIPTFGLDLAEVAADDRVHAWRRAFVRYYDMPGVPERFDARGRAFQLGKAALSDTQHPLGLTLERDKTRARKDGADNIIISMELAGGFEITTEGREDRVGAGRVSLFDVSRPIIKRVAPGRTLALAVSRELIEEALPGLDVHALTLGPEGAMLAEHLRSLRSHIGSTPQEAAPHLVRATVGLVAAAVLPTADRLERARPAWTAALLSRAKRFIRQHSHHPGLTPDKVAAAVGASRSNLYRAFEPEGGVADYIRRARLEGARYALQNPSDARRIGEIAFAFGFSSEAQFSRAMRAAFGMTPSDLRHERAIHPRFARAPWGRD